MIVYVGYVSQSIKALLRYGLNPSKHHLKQGYHGYKRKNLYKVELYVFVFNSFITFKSEEEREKYTLFVEAIEAELVYLCRQKYNR